MSQLIYCDKNTSNTGSCSRLAIFKVDLVNKSNLIKICYRCEKHKSSSTQTKKVNKITTLNQNLTLYDINQKLIKLIGKEFFSNFHNCFLIGKYLKDNASIMCVDSKGRYKLVYHNQIK